MDATEYADGLRELAVFIEDNPDILSRLGSSGITLYAFTIGEDKLAELGEWARRFGKCEKGSDNNYLTVTRSFGPHKIEMNANKEATCERIVVGVERVPKRVIPAHNAEIVEWRCPESFLAGSR